jgi:hypothetical protein
MNHFAKVNASYTYFDKYFEISKGILELRQQVLIQTRKVD